MTMRRRRSATRVCRTNAAAAQRGQAMVEYALLVALLAAVMFVPQPWLEGRSTAEVLLEGMDVYMQGFYAVIALPVP